tara:strand:- start:533 stop:1777 length:1245 start_codon:yes stop_codon:yes gene_type:complete
MKKFFVLITMCVIITFVSSDVFSGEVRTNFGDVDITLGGQLRPRWELDDKSTLATSNSDDFFSQRSRINIGVDGGSISGFVQFQDIRDWGEETSTIDRSADGFDVHQAYLDVKEFAGLPLNIRVGRQEIGLDGHRLIGTVNWVQTARNHDGILISGNVGPAAAAFAYLRPDETDGGTSPNHDAHDWIAYSKAKINEMSAISGILVWQNDDGDATTAAAVDRVTFGPRFTFKSGNIKARVEGYYQTGEESDTVDTQAFMVGARVGYTFDTPKKPSITLWYDYLSGDDNTADDKDKSFSNLYQTGHKYHGHMDYFVADANRTLGLHDIAVKGKISATDNVSLHGAVHYFMTVEDAADNGNDLGTEMDLAAKWKYDKHLGISAGYSHFFNDKLSRTGAASHGDEDADWAYVMMDFKF